MICCWLTEQINLVSLWGMFQLFFLRLFWLLFSIFWFILRLFWLLHLIGRFKKALCCFTLNELSIWVFGSHLNHPPQIFDLFCNFPLFCFKLLHFTLQIKVPAQKDGKEEELKRCWYFSGSPFNIKTNLRKTIISWFVLSKSFLRWKQVATTAHELRRNKSNYLHKLPVFLPSVLAQQYFVSIWLQYLGGNSAWLKGFIWHN